MPIEPSVRISETQIIRREEGATSQQKQKKKQTPTNQTQQQEKEKSGKIDIKI
ncbi:MAG TPA: hypothetical protein VK654_01145 [Nitrospirota bacterium]|nr:hypothetical protein [Nitrospirota bacterium]